MLKLKRAFSIDINSIFYNKHVQAKHYADKTIPRSNSVDHLDERTKKTVRINIDCSKFAIYNSAVNEDAKTFKGSGEFFIAFVYNDTSKTDSFGGLTSDFNASDEKVVIAIRKTAHSVICEYIKNFMGKEYSDKLTHNIDLILPIINTVSNRLLGFTFGYAIRFLGKIDFTIGLWMNEATGDDLTLSKIALGLRNGAISISMKFGLAALHAILSEGVSLLSDIVSFKVSTTYGDFGIPGAKYLKLMGNAIADFAKTTEKKFLAWLKKATTLSVNANTFIHLFTELFNKDYPGNDTRCEVRLINSELLYLQKNHRCSKRLVKMLDSRGCLTKLKYCIKVIVSEEDPNYSFYNIPAIKSLTYRVLGKIYGHVPYLSHIEYLSFNRDREFQTGTLLLNSHELPISFERSGNVVVARIQDVSSMHLKRRNLNLVAYKSPEATGSVTTESYLVQHSKKCLIMETLFNKIFPNYSNKKYNYIFEAGVPTPQPVSSAIIKYVESLISFFYNLFYLKNKTSSKCFDKFLGSGYGDDSYYLLIGSTIITISNPKPIKFDKLQDIIHTKKDFFDELYYIFSNTNTPTDSRGPYSAIHFGVEVFFKAYLKDISTLTFDSTSLKFAITTSTKPEYKKIRDILEFFRLLVNNHNKNKTKSKNNNDDDAIFLQIDNDKAQDVYLIKIPYLTLNAVNSEKD